MADCVFCAIVAGEAPAEVIFEDEDAVAFLDIAPATEGHTLVVPREHYVDLFDIGLERAGRLMTSAVEVAAILRSALGVEAMNLMHASGAAAWQHVYHFHLHLVPRRSVDELTPPWALQHNAAPSEQLAALAQQIRAGALG
jgi:histidine triad (HIT) family protein